MALASPRIKVSDQRNDIHESIDIDVTPTGNYNSSIMESQNESMADEEGVGKSKEREEPQVPNVPKLRFVDDLLKE